MTTPSTIDNPKAIFWGNFAKRGFLALVAIFGLALMAPVLWAALGGAIALIALTVLFVVSWTLRPWVFTKAANLRLSMLKREAAKDPVGTLENIYRERSLDLDRRQKGLVEIATNNGILENEVEEVLRVAGAQNPNYIKLKATYDKLIRVYNHKVKAFKIAEKAQKDFADTVEVARVIYRAGLAAAKASASSGYTEDDFFQELKTQTAFESIDQTYLSAVAAIDVEIDTAEDVPPVLVAAKA